MGEGAAGQVQQMVVPAVHLLETEQDQQVKVTAMVPAAAVPMPAVQGRPEVNMVTRELQQQGQPIPQVEVAVPAVAVQEERAVLTLLPPVVREGPEPIQLHREHLYPGGRAEQEVLRHLRGLRR